jgi:ascorbate-specific PTS system EIIC-type component UlaA
VIHLLRGSAFLTSSEAKAKPRITLYVLIGYFLLKKSRQKIIGSFLETQEDYESIHFGSFLCIFLARVEGIENIIQTSYS